MTTFPPREPGLYEYLVDVHGDALAALSTAEAAQVLSRAGAYLQQRVDHDAAAARRALPREQPLRPWADEAADQALVRGAVRVLELTQLPELPESAHQVAQEPQGAARTERDALLARRAALRNAGPNERPPGEPEATQARLAELERDAAALWEVAEQPVTTEGR